MHPLRRYAVPIFLPAVLFSTAEGCLMPVLPARAVELGADTALAGLVAGLLMIGQVVGDLPSSWVVARIGEQRTMLAAAGLAAVAIVAGGMLPGLLGLMLVVLVVGVAAAAFNLARHALLTEIVPVPYRARAMSVLGGTLRAGLFLGPLLVAPVVARWGTVSALWCAGALAVVLVALLVVLPDPGRRLAPEAAAPQQPERMPLWRTIRDARRVLLTMGAGIAAVQLLRSSRQVILPLWGTHLGLDPEAVAVIMGVAGGVDLALFYASGQIMDRFGRLWVVLPTLVGLALAHLVLLPVREVWGLLAVGMLMSIANGLGSGIVMTLGADLAPRENPTAFLGAWRLAADAGSACSPLLLSALAALAGLGAAAVVMGALGLAGAWTLWRWTPRFLPPELSGRGRIRPRRTR